MCLSFVILYLQEKGRRTMEYSKELGFTKDFVERTLANLEIIENYAKDVKDAYEITQLINSLLGLIVFPKERDECMDLNCLQKYVKISSDKKLSNKDLLRNLRHAISHSHIFFESLKHTKSESSTVKLRHLPHPEHLSG